MKKLFLVLFISLVSLFPTQATVPTVAVTIKPIHSLVAGVMAGVGTPILLMTGDQSPHTTSLSPREVSQARTATLVIWVGPTYESSLRRVMASIDKNHLITLTEEKGMRIYPKRQGGLWGVASSCDHAGCEDDHEVNHWEVEEAQVIDEDNPRNQQYDRVSSDGHIWLNPHNARTIVSLVAKKLGDLDPQNKAVYLENAQTVINRLNDLDREIWQVIEPVRKKPYVVYHDGTQYFDRHFKTNGVGALTGDTHFGINPQHILKIRDRIRCQNVDCVFTEPQFSIEKVECLVNRTGTKIETLDYIGIDLPADQDAYFSMMRRLANGFVVGLSN